jgi:hypothetical protein
MASRMLMLHMSMEALCSQQAYLNLSPKVGHAA